ncbi:SDR family NAD(P)-dependent oxidoreductase [Flavisphingomonas formosensis]|uniref:SDR family NAD(P)-dependent oxidoreductase n=1 Tax=Flavisphingomonas formosensis TaxID=861534 RepID=UPI0018DFD00F|nr:SDR family oxidoreductase [Sphingomonas formosensis]
MGSFSGKRILVTGAGRGIGRAIALAFATEGADLILAARSTGELDEVAGEARALGRKADVVPTDLADRSAVEALAAHALETGGVDVMVSNAAFSPTPSPLLDLPMETWLKTFQVNVGAALILVKALAADMTARPGANIIIVSSIRGLGGTPFGGAYGSSKAALNQMVKTLACELGPQGVRVNAILPGPVLTQMTTDYLPDDKALFDYYGDIAPIKGWTKAEDMVAPALFLAGSGARKVTGHLLIVDGGLSATNQDAFPPPKLVAG